MNITLRVFGWTLFVCTNSESYWGIGHLPIRQTLLFCGPLFIGCRPYDSRRCSMRVTWSK
jgi:hypothetical protein